jgi:hypothetical protein
LLAILAALLSITGAMLLKAATLLAILAVLLSITGTMLLMTAISAALSFILVFIVLINCQKEILPPKVLF